MIFKRLMELMRSDSRRQFTSKRRLLKPLLLLSLIVHKVHNRYTQGKQYRLAAVTLTRLSPQRHHLILRQSILHIKSSDVLSPLKSIYFFKTTIDSSQSSSNLYISALIGHTAWNYFTSMIGSRTVYLYYTLHAYRYFTLSTGSIHCSPVLLSCLTTLFLNGPPVRVKSFPCQQGLRHHINDA